MPPAAESWSLSLATGLDLSPQSMIPEDWWGAPIRASIYACSWRAAREDYSREIVGKEIMILASLPQHMKACSIQKQAIWLPARVSFPSWLSPQRFSNPCKYADLGALCTCQGIQVGEFWKDRLDCRQWGAHFPHVAGIAGQGNTGAQSVVLSGGQALNNLLL